MDPKNIDIFLEYSRFAKRARSDPESLSCGIVLTKAGLFITVYPKIPI